MYSTPKKGESSSSAQAGESLAADKKASTSKEKGEQPPNSMDDMFSLRHDPPWAPEHVQETIRLLSPLAVNTCPPEGAPAWPISVETPFDAPVTVC